MTLLLLLRRLMINCKGHIMIKGRFFSIFAVLLLVLNVVSLNATIINVPADYQTIQTAINSASAGDTILIARGTYLQDSLIVDKKLTLASDYINSQDEADVENTIIQATSSAGKQWFQVNVNDTKIIGLRINGNDEHSIAITCTYAEIVHCMFIGGKDQISFEDGGGYIGYCYIEGAGDDGIDADNSIDWIIEHNTIVNSHQDGIEVRLHDKSGPLTTHIFRYNTIINAGESGIQLINYPGDSYRKFKIYGNIFKDCMGAGVSCMYNKNTTEDYKGSDMEESAIIYNNTFDGCNYAITEAPHLIILNNIIANCKTKGIGRGIYVTDSNDSSIVDYCNFFTNLTDYDADISIGSTIYTYDPQFANMTTYDLLPGSECIDAGTAGYSWLDETVLSIPDSAYVGAAPDLGAVEFDPKLGVAVYQRTPKEYSLGQNYPNPFNPSTKINFELASPAFIKLSVYNTVGQKIKDLISGYQKSGKHTVFWNGTNELGNMVPSGVYMYQLVHYKNSDQFNSRLVDVKKMIFLK